MVGVVRDLRDCLNRNNDWKVSKNRLKEEGSELFEKIGQVKIQSHGKFYKTDLADTKQLFRLINSFPSSIAEPLKPN
jgi:hypothetical protein